MDKGKSTKIELFGVEFDNPLILASGVVGTTPKGLQSAVDAGAGGVVTKSLGLEARVGHNSPNVVEVDCGYLNAMGLPNPGADYFVQELGQKTVTAPVFASIFGETPEDFARLSRVVSPAVDGIELNLSCPHADKVGSAVGTDPRLVKEIVGTVAENTERPVLAKLTPNTSQLIEIGTAAESAGADGLVAINTVSGMAIDVNAKRPILGNVTGGLSGPAIHPVAVKAVYDLYDQLEIPIIGVGGVETVDSAIELILAGASAVQIGTAIATRGISIFSEIDRGIKDYLEKEELELGNTVGLAHRR